MPVAFQAAVELPRESYEYETAEICLTMILLLSGETEEAKKSGAKPAKDRTLALVFPVPVRLPTLSAPTSRCQVSLEASRKETSQWIQTSPLVIINWTPPGQEPRQNHSKYGDLRVFETQSLPPGCDRLQSVTLRRNSSPGGLPPRGGASLFFPQVERLDPKADKDLNGTFSFYLRPAAEAARSFAHWYPGKA
ncbi:hypothetical protein CIHG_03789 [Coccidioides immitis H538.4]|uniref:Uncharacterized protein n=3 Tax=Coccidioides immitis TaxID=5501 RepID=A0A0J8R0G0_COCIT|nr:hypothetical protein CIRG_04970 [Coccidioides immitis RMSCC 2394]KMU77820.1 hypothetical protein CISG_01576 [Coccidioides immitis RMSCC 3703]KMU85749.1 hypothetical protein CIHG_03789 [Coccidioides immitis H538.4]